MSNWQRENFDHELPEEFKISIDAAFQGTNDKKYLFKGDRYIRYSDIEQEYVDEGFPKPIKDNWGNLPVDFEAGIDGAFVFEGRNYFLMTDIRQLT